MELDEKFVKNALERAWIDGADYAQRTGRTDMTGIKEYVRDLFGEICNDGINNRKR